MAAADQLPDTMHAVLLTGHGGFDRLDYRDDVAVPAPGSGEVLVRVGAAGVNNTDINTRTGWYSKEVTSGTTADIGPTADADAVEGDASWGGAALAFPRIQGADVCGRIAAVGADVDRGRIGERVLVEPCLRFPDRVEYLGSECDGGFAEFVAVPAAFAWKVESALSDAELASFPCSYSTAENMLTRADVREGETVLVTGASGGVGSAAVQLARRRGARVLAVAGAAKADAVQALGAEEVIPRGADLIETVGRDRVEAVVDLVAGAQWPQLLEVLRPGGRYATAGAIAGPLVELDVRTLYLKDLSLFGCTVLREGVFGNLVGTIERGDIRPVVAAMYPLSEIVQAQEAFLSKQHTGKIVLVPPA